MTGPTLLTPADHRRVPWRNGRGTTTEIAWEAGAEGGFLWRFSLAGVAEDGPFSAFPGIDRLILVAEGAGMDLVIDGAPPVAVPRVGPALAFSGDAAVLCALDGGPVTAANLMVERGTTAELVALPPGGAWRAGGGVVIVHALAGTLEVLPDGGDGLALPAGCTALLRDGAVRVAAGTGSRGLCAVVRPIHSR